MFRLARRLAVVVAAVVLVGGSSFAGVAVARRDSGARDRAALEARIAALEAGSNTRIAALEAGSKARLDGLGNELTGLRQAVQSDGRTVKVSGEAYLPSNLNAVVIAFEVHPTRATVGAAMSATSFLASKVTSAAKNVGVASGDLRTIWDGAHPSYNPSGRYTAQARVLATVRHLKNIDTVSKAALAVGKDVELGYVTVSDESDTGALAAARADALKEARAKAIRYAAAAGKKLGTLTSLSEEVSPESAPAEPGDGEYSYRPTFIVIVDAVYELS